ncbi:MAG: YpmS family protein [Bacillota bacterium]|nr:YpmS family protein [Bacillota bacterium]MDP4154854.1 YpmS family protein [Bacillota bacterium]
MKNKWKLGFFILLGIDLLIVMLIMFLVLTPVKKQDLSNVQEPAGDYVPFYVQSNKEDLNKLINYYLKKQANHSPVAYQVNLGNEVEMEGAIPILGEELSVKLTFDPEPQKNGDLVLKQQKISLGRLQLPVPYVLKLIEDNYNLPTGVEIKPDQQIVYIDMQKFTLKNNAKVKVDQFDLKQNKLAFTILVPVK